MEQGRRGAAEREQVEEREEVAAAEVVWAVLRRVREGAAFVRAVDTR